MVFQGYVDGVPARVLSGGRYDKLMERLGKHSGAIGFAVYLDQLERLGNAPVRMWTPCSSTMRTRTPNKCCKL